MYLRRGTESMGMVWYIVMITTSKTLHFFSEFGAQIMTDAHINVTLALTDARTRRVEESSFVQR